MQDIPNITYFVTQIVWSSVLGDLQQFVMFETRDISPKYLVEKWLLKILFNTYLSSKAPYHCHLENKKY